MWLKWKGAVKSERIYDIINKSGGTYVCPVGNHVRSRVNIPFRVGKDNVPNDDLEAKFLSLAAAHKPSLVQLKGHRSVGGIRASLYNAMSIEETEVLANFMESFATSI